MTAPPATVRPGRVAAAGTRFAALLGEPGPDVPARGVVLLVSGFFGSKEDFEPLVAVLSRAGYRVCAYDQRGQHETPGPDDPSAYTVRALASDLRAVAEEVGDGRPPHVVGHCAGGIVARAAVLAARDAFASLTLLGCPLRVPRTGAAALTGGAEMIARLGVRTLRPMVAQWARAEPRRKSLMEERMRTTQRAHLVGFARALAASTGDLVTDLARTGVPVLVVHGAGDTREASREDFQRLAQRFGRASVRVPGASHNAQIDQPEATAEALIHFWSEQPAAGRAV